MCPGYSSRYLFIFRADVVAIAQLSFERRRMIGQKPFLISNIARPIAAALCFALFSTGAALAGETPAALSGTKLVTAEETAKAIAGGAIPIDTRAASEYSEGHIKGALNVPYRERSAKSVDFDANQDQFDLQKLPANKETPIVLYCAGVQCWKSYKASIAANKAGYSNINWYREGFPDWKAKGLQVD
jgi:rhodanese-related sulfurtransferase